VAASDEVVAQLLARATIAQAQQTDEERTSKLAIAEKDAEHKDRRGKRWPIIGGGWS